MGAAVKISGCLRLEQKGTTCDSTTFASQQFGVSQAKEQPAIFSSSLTLSSHAYSPTCSPT